MDFLKRAAILVAAFAFSATAQAAIGANANAGFHLGSGGAWAGAGANAYVGPLSAHARADAWAGRYGIGARASGNIGFNYYGGPGYVSPRGRYQAPRSSYNYGYKRRTYHRKSYRTYSRPVYRSSYKRYSKPRSRTYSTYSSPKGYTRTDSYQTTYAYPARQSRGKHVYSSYAPKQSYNSYAYNFRPTGGCQGADWKFRCQASGYGSAKKSSVLFIFNWYQRKSSHGSIICQKKGANGKVTTMRPLPLNINMSLKTSSPLYGSTCSKAGFKTPQLCDNDPMFKERRGGDIRSEHELVRTMTLIARNPKVSSSSVTKVGIMAGLGNALQAEVGVQHKRLGYANRIQAGFKLSAFGGPSCRVGINIFEQSKFSVGQTLPAATCRVAAKKTPQGAPDDRICHAPYTPRYGHSRARYSTARSSYGGGQQSWQQSVWQSSSN